MNNDRVPHTWTAICRFDDIVPNTGVCALVNGEQVAIFRVSHGDADSSVYAIDNFDPGSQAAVLSRGLIGSLGERTTSICAPASASKRRRIRSTRLPREWKTATCGSRFNTSTSRSISE
jgi:nitrite reductase/ring-hydroxylating ferredoxin subunit